MSQCQRPEAAPIGRYAHARENPGCPPWAVIRRCCARRVSTMVCPPVSCKVRCRVPGLSSRAAMTAATSARGIAPGDRGGGASRDTAGGWIVGQAAWTHDGPVQIPGPQVVLGGGLGRDVGRPHLTAARLRWHSGSHRGDLHEPADPGPLGGTGHQDRGRPVHGVLAPGTTPGQAGAGNTTASALATSTGDILGPSPLQVANDRFSAGHAHIVDLGRVPESAHGLVPAPSHSNRLQQQRHLPVHARYHHPRATTLQRSGSPAGPRPSTPAVTGRDPPQTDRAEMVRAWPPGVVSCRRAGSGCRR